MLTPEREAQSFVHSFIRLEDKYLLPQSQLENLSELINARTLSTSGQFKREYYSIESTYFDSSELNIYQNHFNSPERRSKLRVRSYLNFTNSEGAVPVRKKSFHLELKVKENEICNKERLKVEESHFAKLCRGEIIECDERIEKRNSNIDFETLHLRIEKINNEVQKYKMRPSCVVSYERNAFEEEDFRVTYDDHLDFTWLQELNSDVTTKLKASSLWERAQLMRNNFRKVNSIVVELKHKGTIPSWITKFFENHPKVSFSKYCYAVTENICSR